RLAADCHCAVTGHARARRAVRRPGRCREGRGAVEDPRLEAGQHHRKIVTWLDYAVAGVLLFCVLWGLWRGLVREVVSVLGWVIAFFAANLFAGPLGQVLPAEIPTPELRVAAAFVAVFVCSLIVTTLIGLLLSKMVKAVGLEGLDRTLGALFGTAKGVLILVAVALRAALTSAPRRGYWRDSIVGEPLARSALLFKQLLPPTFAERLRYD